MKEHTMTVDWTWNALLTYLTAGFALFVAHSNSITAVLGFVLLVARLVYELPRAYEALRKNKNKE